VEGREVVVELREGPDEETAEKDGGLKESDICGGEEAKTHGRGLAESVSRDELETAHELCVQLCFDLCGVCEGANGREIVEKRPQSGVESGCACDYA
jgi:hypothetical protein